MFCVLIEFHVMIGIDLHKDIVPPPAPPTPVMSPHLTTAMLNWVMPPSFAKNVRSTWTYGRVMQRGTDIQSFIPHIPLTPACLLSPILTIFSGSKSYFGPSRVKANGAAVAAAILGVVNINLNCGDIPTPTGVVIAPNTVLTNMTFGDILGSLFAMASDAAMQALLNAGFGFLGPVGGSVAQLFVGSPLGFSLNADGTGPIGYFGRSMGVITDGARGLGELLGGAITGNARDVAQGKADLKAANAKALAVQEGRFDNPVTGFVAPANRGGILGGIEDASNAHARQAQRNAPGPAFDNPAAEQF